MNSAVTVDRQPGRVAGSDPAAAVGAPTVAVVIPTVGRPSLRTLLDALTVAHGPDPQLLVIVDDRPHSTDRPAEPVVDVRAVPARFADRVVVARSGGKGPAAARNVGWRLVPDDVDWVAFLDDDVVVGDHWFADLAADLNRAADPVIAASQGQITVPLARERRPTDWERVTAGLATAAWITADIAYRREVLSELDGFDERFPRAYREDSDLALRVQRTGRRLVVGRRGSRHPVRRTDRWVSLRQQRGNRDDALMRRLHGPGWADRAGAAPGRRGRHALVAGSGLLAAAAAVGRRRRLAGASATAWALGTAEFAFARLRPGPRDRGEITTMVVTSVAIPPVAVWHWLRGWVTRQPARPLPATAPPVRAVLFDRDATLIEDVPFNGDPERVKPMPGALAAVAAVRAAGLPVGVVTNQSGIGRGLISEAQVRAVNARVDELFGGFDTWSVCPHAPEHGCRCRKPAAGLVIDAAAALGVAPHCCAVIGDIGADVEAATAAGARAVLVPGPATRAPELAAADIVCADLRTAVRLLLAADR